MVSSESHFECGVDYHFAPETNSSLSIQVALEVVLVVRPQQARWWGLRAAMSMARALLAPIFGWFGEGFDAPVVKEAKALLDELAWYTASCL